MSNCYFVDKRKEVTNKNSEDDHMQKLEEKISEFSRAAATVLYSSKALQVSTSQNKKSCYTLSQLLAETPMDLPRVEEWDGMKPVGLEKL